MIEVSVYILISVFRLLDTVMSLQRLGFISGSHHVRFVVGRVTFELLNVLLISSGNHLQALLYSQLSHPLNMYDRLYQAAQYHVLSLQGEGLHFWPDTWSLNKEVSFSMVAVGLHSSVCSYSGINDGFKCKHENPSLRSMQWYFCFQSTIIRASQNLLMENGLNWFCHCEEEHY